MKIIVWFMSSLALLLGLVLCQNMYHTLLLYWRSNIPYCLRAENVNVSCKITSPSIAVTNMAEPPKHDLHVYDDLIPSNLQKQTLFPYL